MWHLCREVEGIWAVGAAEGNIGVVLCASGS